MPVLIDGYNLMHALRDSRWGSEAVGRALLCRLLGKWAAATHQDVTVVFDGREPNAPLAGQLADPRIDVYYSRQRTADAVLIDLIAASSAPRRLLVVTSDREIQRRARQRDAPVVRSEQFIADLVRDLAPTRPPDEPADKHRGPPPDVGDDWLRAFGFDPDEEPPFEHP